MNSRFNIIFASTEWYQQGNWPLVGAILVLIITNAISLWSIVLQSRRGLTVQLKIQRIELLSQQLTEFYNPLYSLLAANQHVFLHFGPRTFPTDELLRQAAGENWNAMKMQVILPNNDRIADILRTQSHLVSDSDDITNYLDLNNHIAFYRVFSERATEAYKLHQFPVDITQHIDSKRSEVIQQLNFLRAIGKA